MTKKVTQARKGLGTNSVGLATELSLVSKLLQKESDPKKISATGSFVLSPGFARLEKPTWRIFERCVRPRLIHRKIGECEQPIQENIGEVLGTFDRVENLSDEQSDGVRNFIHRKDVLMVLLTGFGKS